MSSSIRVTHAIFDLDGLIVDTERRYDEAYEKVCQKFGKHFTFELKQMTTSVPFLDTAQIIVDYHGLPLTAVECDQLFEKLKGPRESKLLPGVERLIRHLHSVGIPMAIATGSTAESLAWKSAPHKELFSLFSHLIAIPDDPQISHGKPHPEPFLVAASRFTRQPVSMANVIVFEDGLAGVKAANDAGMLSVWVPDPVTPLDFAPNPAPFRRLSTLELFKPEEFGIAPFQ